MRVRPGRWHNGACARVAVAGRVGENRDNQSHEGADAMSLADVQNKTYEFDAEDVEYLRHGDKPLLARVYKPRGEGPFPALVEVHGGAWCLSDRFTEKLRHEHMARNGVVSIAL